MSLKTRAEKRVGLFGGTNWISTVDYYRTINEMVASQTSGAEASKILLWSANYPEIKKHYSTNWPEARRAFSGELRSFLECRPASLLICNHTLHKAFDEVRNELRIDIPVFHALELTIQEARVLGYRRLLVLGTEFFMRDGYWVRQLSENGIKAAPAEEKDWRLIQSVQNAVTKSELTLEMSKAFEQLLRQYKGYDAVVLACTELSSLITSENSPVPILNPLHLQCRQAVSWLLSKG